MFFQFQGALTSGPDQLIVAPGVMLTEVVSFVPQPYGVYSNVTELITAPGLLLLARP